MAIGILWSLLKIVAVSYSNEYYQHTTVDEYYHYMSVLFMGQFQYTYINPLQLTSTYFNPLQPTFIILTKFNLSYKKIQPTSTHFN